MELYALFMPNLITQNMAKFCQIFNAKTGADQKYIQRGWWLLLLLTSVLSLHFDTFLMEMRRPVLWRDNFTPPPSPWPSTYDTTERWNDTVHEKHWSQLEKNQTRFFSLCFMVYRLWIHDPEHWEYWFNFSNTTLDFIYQSFQAS